MLARAPAAESGRVPFPGGRPLRLGDPGMRAVVDRGDDKALFFVAPTSSRGSPARALLR
jgi:hypothetical protein